MWFSDEMLGIPFPDFKPCFTPLQNQNLETISLSFPHNTPVHSNSTSGEPNGSPNQEGDEQERKRKRMISNRESARRSRKRKQEHLEGLRNQMKIFKFDNKEMENRLGILTQNFQLIQRDNDRLRLESEILRRRLLDYHRILILQKLQQFSPLMMFECR